MARLRLLALLAACALHAAVAVSHPGWDASTLPSPGTHPASCGRAHVEHSWLCDPDKLLSVEGGDAVEAALAAIHRAAPARSAAAAAAGEQQAPVYPHATCEGKPSRGYEARARARSLAFRPQRPRALPGPRRARAAHTQRAHAPRAGGRRGGAPRGRPGQPRGARGAACKGPARRMGRGRRMRLRPPLAGGRGRPAGERNHARARAHGRYTRPLTADAPAHPARIGVCQHRRLRLRRRV